MCKGRRITWYSSMTEPGNPSSITLHPPHRGIHWVALLAWIFLTFPARPAGFRFPLEQGKFYRLEGTTNADSWTVLEPAIFGDAPEWVRSRSDYPAAIREVRLVQESVVDLNPTLEKLRAKHGVPALAAILVRSNRVIAAGAVGVRVQGSEIPVEMGDLWHQGSITKSMTATLAGILVDEGRIHWTSTLGQILGPRVPGMHEDWRDVTLGQLLRHRSGAPDHDELVRNKIWDAIWNQRGPMSGRRLHWLTAVTTNPPPTAPGTRFVYSNTGYVFAGMMLEQVSGQPWEDLLRTRLFLPLGMHTAGFGPPATRGHTNQPWGHEWIHGKPSGIPPGRNADNPQSLGPAGTVHGSLFDLAKYLMFHARPAEGEGVRLVSPETFQRLHEAPVGESYAFGWHVMNRAWAGGDVLHHTGSNTQWFSNAWIAPGKQAALIAVTNIGDGSGKKAFNVTDEALSRMIASHVGR